MTVSIQQNDQNEELPAEDMQNIILMQRAANSIFELLRLMARNASHERLKSLLRSRCREIMNEGRLAALLKSAEFNADVAAELFQAAARAKKRHMMELLWTEYESTWSRKAQHLTKVGEKNLQIIWDLMLLILQVAIQMLRQRQSTDDAGGGIADFNFFLSIVPQLQSLDYQKKSNVKRSPTLNQRVDVLDFDGAKAWLSQISFGVYMLKQLDEARTEAGRAEWIKVVNQIWLCLEEQYQYHEADDEHDEITESSKRT